MANAPHAVLLGVVVAVVVGAPFLLGDGREVITSAFSRLLSPAGLFLLPIGLLILIRLLSSDRIASLSDFFSFGGGGPESIHRIGGSPVGIALLLVVLLFLLHNRVSLFRGGGDGDE